MSAIAYPSSLPVPSAAPLDPAERRLLSTLPGPREARPIQRDRLAQQHVEFVFTHDELVTFTAWLDATLVRAGAWFAADWPQPAGGVGVRRFIGAPSYPVYYPTLGWHVSAQCEVRGRGLLPMEPEPRPNIWLYLRGERAQIIDSSVNSRAVIPHGAAATTTDQAYSGDGCIALLGDGDYLETDVCPLAKGRWDVRVAVHVGAAPVGHHMLLFQDGYTPGQPADRKAPLRLRFIKDEDSLTHVVSYGFWADGFVNANGNGFSHLVGFVPTGPWAHFRCVRDAGGTSVYIDGTLRDSKPNFDGIGDAGKVFSTPDGGLCIGRHTAAEPLWCRSYVDEVWIDTQG